MGDGTEEKPYTRKDVLRLIKKHGGTAEGLDLSEKYFEDEIDLSKLELKGIILNKARLWYANLEETDLRFAHLKGASLPGTNLEETDLWFADLEGASLYNAQFSFYTRLEDVDWGNYILGEERRGDKGEFPDIIWLWIAEATYRRLKMWHTEHGLYDIAAKFYYREKEARRKAPSWGKKPHLKLWSWILRILCGYGEKPERVIISAAVVVFGLATAYWLWGSFSSSSFWDTLYYSVASFTALGYGNWAPQPTGWAKGIGAAEAVLGVSMLALFLVTFTRKMVR